MLVRSTPVTNRIPRDARKRTRRTGIRKKLKWQLRQQRGMLEKLDLGRRTYRVKRQADPLLSGRTCARRRLHSA